MNTEIRAQFEAWADAFGVDLERNIFTGKYMSQRTDDLWCTWQSAKQNINPSVSSEKWLPISSAPKDVTVIDLWNFQNGVRITGMKWGECSDPREPPGWVNEHGSWACHCQKQYSHWREIPAPPLQMRKEVHA